MERSGPLPLGRRPLLGIGAGLGLTAAAALVLRNQLRHPHRDKASRPDGRYRRLLLSCPHPEHDPVLMVAAHQGMFARYNLDVTIQGGFASGQEAVARLQAGGADVAIAPALSWLPRLLGDLDARLICGLQSGSARLLVDRRSPVRRIEDLHRKAIGIADYGADRLFFSIVMRRKGMDPNHDVTWVQLPPDQFGQALAERRVQAVAGHDPVIWQVREQLHLAELASSMTGSYGTRVSRVLGIGGNLWRSDPSASVSLVLAVQEAAAAVQRHLGETASILADQLPDMDQQALERMLRAEGHAVHPVGHELREQVAQYIDEMKLIGLAPDEADSGALARRFCPLVIHN